MTERNIPSLNKAIQNATSVPEIILNQVEILRNERNDIHLSIFANKLVNYYKYITDRDLLEKQREHFEAFYKELNDIYEDMLFRISGRRKSLLSAYKKLWNSSSDATLKDISGFRITLFGNNPKELVNQCYLVLQHLFEYSIKNGFLPCIAEKPKNTKGFAPEEHPDVFIPDTIPLSKEIQPYVKDYVQTPKENGYQSLHIIFKDSELNYFEVQIRTIYMHMVAEFGKAAHDEHKAQYANLDIDRESIRIPGYYIQDGKLYDWVGFEESLEILRRQKTY